MVYTTVDNLPHDHWSMLSLYHTLGKVQTAVFGLDASMGQQLGTANVFPSALLLAGITIISLTVVYHRVSSPLRI